MSVTATADWQRQDQGGENIAANALLAYILGNAAALATGQCQLWGVMLLVG